MKIWPCSIQYSLHVSGPAGQRASLSPDHKGNQQNHRPGEKPRSRAQRKSHSHTEVGMNPHIKDTRVCTCTEGVPEGLIHFLSNTLSHLTAPTFTHVEDYPARSMKGNIPLTHMSLRLFNGVHHKAADSV